MSTAPPAKTLLSQGQAKVGPSGLFVPQLEPKQAASLAQAGGLLSPLTSPVHLLPFLGSSSAARRGGSGDGQWLLPDVGGFPWWKAPGGPRGKGCRWPGSSAAARSASRTVIY